MKNVLLHISLYGCHGAKHDLAKIVKFISALDAAPTKMLK